MSHTSDSVCVPQLLAWACSTTSQRLKAETSPVTMLICGCWVVVALVIVAHSAGAAEGLLLLLFLPLPLAPPEANAAAGLISAVAAIAAVTSIFLLNIRVLPAQVDCAWAHSSGSRRNRNGTLVGVLRRLACATAGRI